MRREKYPRIIKRYGDRRDRREFDLRKIIYPILTIALMVLIFWFSSQQAPNSQELSDGILYEFIRLFDGILPPVIIAFMEEYIRKVAHFVIYMMLGIFMGNTLFAWMVPESEYDITITPDPRNPEAGTYASRRAWLLSLVICVLYAISDEIHQTFVPGRSGEVRDVLLDSCGIILGLLLFLIGVVAKKQKMHRRAMKKLG